MLPVLVVCGFVLGTLFPEATRQATDFRQNQLETAVFASDLAGIDAALANGAAVNAPLPLTALRQPGYAEAHPRLQHYFQEETRATALIVAAALGRAEVCRHLLGCGARRRQASAWGWVPAQYAAKCGYPELAQTLFDADPLAARFRIVIGISPQTIVLYRDGTPVISGKISSGKAGHDTPPGRYLVTDKERTRRSSLYKVSMPYFLRLSFSEYGIHQGNNPGHPASHGCIRVGKEGVAKALFEQTPIGTLVTVR